MARNEHTRGLRDEARVGPAPRPARELKRLSDLRYKVADGEPDIRTWKVYSSTGREFGVVDDLLVDTEAGEVVMVDVDLKRDDRHAYVPLRAAWIDHATRRVVVEASAMTDDESLPALPHSGALSDEEVDRFDRGYARTYGDRGLDREHSWRLRRGDEELRFGGRDDRDERAGEPWDGATTVGAAGLGAAAASHARTAHPADRPLGRDDRDDRHVRELRGDELREAERRERALHDAGGATGAVSARDRSDEGPRRLLDPNDTRTDARTDPRAPRDTSGSPLALPTPEPGTGGAYLEESRRIDAVMSDDRRTSRVDDARTLSDEQAITPMELDARTRLDEGASIDDRTPVQGVTYDGPVVPPHSYGQPADRYGAGAGDGRIGFDRVVSRRPWSDDATRDRDLDRAPGRDRDRDGIPDAAEAHDDRSLLQKMKDGVERATDRVTDRAHTSDRVSDDASTVRPVRYRRYEDPYDPGAPKR